MTRDMQNDSYFISSLQRLNEIFSKRYGCSIQYLTPEDIKKISLANANNPAAHLFFQKGEPQADNEQVLLPLYVNNTFAGAARISKPDQIQSKDRQDIFQFISLVMERRLEQAFGDDVRSFTEEVARTQEYSNVIPLRPAQKGTLYPLINKAQNSNSFSFSFLIESQNSEDILKMALEIHDRTQRIAFVRLEDIDDSAFESVDAISNLGNITVFAQDITKISHSRQRSLMKFFETPRDKWSPQFIAGTSLTHSQLRNDVRVYNALIPSLSVGYLRMTQPFSFYRKENLLEFFFDGLTGRNST